MNEFEINLNVCLQKIARSNAKKVDGLEFFRLPIHQPDTAGNICIREFVSPASTYIFKIYVSAEKYKYLKITVLQQ